MGEVWVADRVRADLNPGTIQLDDLIARHITGAIDEAANDVGDRREMVRLENRKCGCVEVRITIVDRDHDRLRRQRRGAGEVGAHLVESDGVITVRREPVHRSEERRVGKECRARWWTYH